MNRLGACRIDASLGALSLSLEASGSTGRAQKHALEHCFHPSQPWTHRCTDRPLLGSSCGAKSGWANTDQREGQQRSAQGHIGQCRRYFPRSIRAADGCGVCAGLAAVMDYVTLSVPSSRIFSTSALFSRCGFHGRSHPTTTPDYPWSGSLYNSFPTRLRPSRFPSIPSSDSGCVASKSNLPQKRTADPTGKSNAPNMLVSSCAHQLSPILISFVDRDC